MKTKIPFIVCIQIYSLTTIFSVILLVLFFSKRSYADFIFAYGLSIQCEDCINHGNGYCESGELTNRTLKHCKTVFADLILSMQDNNLSKLNLDNRKILEVLIEEEIDTHLSKALLQILISNKGGVILFERHFLSLLELYPDNSVSLIKNGKVPKEASKRVLKDNFLILKDKPEVLSAFFSNGIEATPAEIIALISRLNVKDSILASKTLSKVLKQSYPQVSYSLDSMVKRLISCSHISLNKIPSLCEDNLELPLEFQQYTAKAKRYYILELGAMNANSSPSEVLSLIAQMDYKTYRGNRSHNLVLTILKSSLAKKEYNWIYQGNKNVFQMINFFSKHDSEIYTVVKDIANDIRKTKSQLATTNSFLIIMKLDNSTNENIWFWVFLPVLITLIYIASLLIRKTKLDLKPKAKKNNRAEIMRDALKQQDARLKLEELLKYFGLQIGSTQHDLRKVYASRAKKLHPDTGKDKINQQFNELQSKYEEAKHLLKSNS